MKRNLEKPEPRALASRMESVIDQQPLAVIPGFPFILMWDKRTKVSCWNMESGPYVIGMVDNLH